MADKVKGAQRNCLNCKQVLVCREIEYQGVKKLQWQDEKVEQAHYGFDKNLGKPFCKVSAQAGELAGSKVTAPDKTHIKNIDLPLEQIAQITKEAGDGAKRMIVALSVVETICEAAGITHPAKVGMIFNQVCENRR